MPYFRHTSRADSQVGRPMANTKAVQKLFSFLKRMWLAIQLLWVADSVSQVNCVHITHARVIIFCTHSQTMFVINNISKVFNSIKIFDIMNCMHKISILQLFVLYLCCLIK